MATATIQDGSVRDTVSERRLAETGTIQGGSVRDTVSGDWDHSGRLSVRYG